MFLPSYFLIGKKITRGRRAISEIIGVLMMVAIVTVVGTAILFPGLAAIEDFRNVMEVEGDKADSARESLLIEHVRFNPTSDVIIISVRNIGTISAIVDTITIVKIDTQDLLLNQNAINDEIFVKEVSDITYNANLVVGTSVWQDHFYNDKSYEISVTTVRGNSFKVVAIPYNT